MEVALIVAGGSGNRMSSGIPKQFMKLAGKPVLMHSILAFYNYYEQIKIIVVLPETGLNTWSQLKDQFEFSIPHQVVTGGSSRTESVRKGLKLVDEQDIVAIHDGVRPLISTEIILAAFKTAKKFGNAVVSVKLKESLRKLTTDGGSISVDRKDFRLMQTPQVFQGDLIKRAYKKTKSLQVEFTDDASLAEYCGISINLVEGDYGNIKITTPEDLEIAEAIIRSRKID